MMLDDRFWTKVRRGNDGECWEWTAYKSPKGYGRFQVGGIVGPRFAHRVSYEAHIGRIPEGLFVLHRCDNPACVNPDHLWLGSKADNNRDMTEKGRRRSNPPKGEASPVTTHTTAQVTAIRADYLAGRRTAEICVEYGVKKSFIMDIVRGRTWKHLGADLETLKAKRKQRMKSAAKITGEIATEIRRRLAAGERPVDLAVAYGLTTSTVSEIKFRKIWADVA